MRAQFQGQGRITIEPSGDVGEGVRVDVAACALCGSDLRPWRQGWPCTPGHEIAGRVNELGHPMHGRRVVVYIPAFCGGCPMCRAGHTQLCETAALVGWQRPGGYADHIRVPGQCLLPLPDDVSDRLAPLVLDTVGTSAHGVRLAARMVEPGSALVIGAGPVGLGGIIVLRRMGWGPVMVREPNPYRATMAARLGAELVDMPAVAPRLVLECSGKDAGRQLALECVAPYGAVVQLGEADAWAIAETKPIRRKDFYWIRSFYFPIGDYAANLDLLRADRAEYEQLIDDTAPLDGLEAMFAQFARGERLKPLMCPA